MKWMMIAVLMSHIQNYREDFVSRETCLDSLKEIALVAKGDFRTGICEEMGEDGQIIEISSQEYANRQEGE